MNAEVVDVTPELAAKWLIGWSTSIHSKPSLQMMLAVTNRAWNNWQQGERPKILRWKASVEDMPGILAMDGETISTFGWAK